MKPEDAASIKHLAEAAASLFRQAEALPASDAEGRKLCREAGISALGKVRELLGGKQT